MTTDTIVVEAADGRIRGRRVDGGSSFLGIPYGRPPVGALRLRPPVPVEGWTGELDATAFGPSAPQSPSMLAPIAGTIDEDCLNLNVWTPDPSAHGLPVMVWIHGGGFTTGSGSIPWYDGARLAARGVVVVTINYRLGALGFLHLEGIGGPSWRGSGNAGLLDQALALEWVRRNAAAFGGDPRRVTIFGESAGGMSVASQLAFPASSGLFVRAIAQSGSATHVHSAEVAERIARSVLDVVGVAPDDLDRLAELPAQAFVDAEATAHDVEGAILPLPFMPVVDGTTMPRAPMEAIAAGVAAGVDLVCGTNAEEMRLFNLMSLVSGETADLADDRLGRRVERALAARGIDRTADAVIATYRRRLGDVGNRELFTAISSDLVFRIPAIELAEAHAPHGPTRMYLFGHPSTAFDGALGAAHAVEIPFVFDNLDVAGIEFMLGPMDDERRRLASEVADAWARFAAVGDPSTRALGSWPTYSTDRRATMHLDLRPELLDDPWGEERAAWAR